MSYDANFLAVLASGVFSMIVGFLWYSPMFFGKQWMKEMNITEEKMEEMKKKGGLGKTYGLSFIAALVTAYVLSVIIDAIIVENLREAVEVAVLLWVGFILTIKFTDVLFAAKSRSLFLIDSGYQLASIVIMMIILVLWK